MQYTIRKYTIIRERELYNLAYGRFISKHVFDPIDYLSGVDLMEYKYLLRETQINPKKEGTK